MTTGTRPSGATGAGLPGTWCHWHKGPSLTAALIDAVEQTSGPGYAKYACAPCREQRGLVPAAGAPERPAS
ncbi:hypothetical protein J7E96_10400 [Streptomyces sp. ISL-96]|uniref:hypothetical protein n=1 Tax=Streptomyces sp. ISL-96 TaxID=2819191 RepID=UPI001BE83EEC|nr:hypothetical protein [Streptomyces sp. ISL-96]MBT2488927.1 hypothetical protein [Streptomyces sp. ISL-96]